VNTFWRLLCLLKAHIWLMLLGALLSVITVLANISLLAISGWFITLMAIAGISGVTVNYFTPAAIIRFLAIVRTAGRYAERLLTHRATFNALAQLRHYFYQQLEPLLPYYRLDLRSADLLARLQQDIDQLDNFYLRVLLPMLVALISVPIVCWILALISPVVAAVSAAALLLVGLLLPLLSYTLAKRSAQHKVKLQSLLKLELVSGISAIRELLIYQVSGKYQQSISGLSDSYYKVQYQLVRNNALLGSVIFVITHLLALFCVIYLSPQVLNGEFDAKLLVAITLLILVSFETVMNMPLALQLLPETLASARRLFDIIDLPRPVTRATKAVVAGDIVFNELSFSYPQHRQLSLKQISLQIAQGQKVAIIGASGAGKSTLVNLLMGFWPIAATPDNRSGLSIAGTDINLLESESLRNHIALMSQQGHLFEATIADNLRLANASADLQQMRDVCEAVGLLAFIDTLEKRFDTWLGETGSGLSGGQAQRLRLAQLLLRPAKVLIVDEPSKGLDKRSEQRVMQSLLAHVNARRQSLILITHKPLLLQQMDSIVLMQEGEIIDQGSHQQLQKSNQYYRQLLNYF